MKTITIPERFGYPTVDITINGKEQTFASGVEISVEDYIAEAIENAIALDPKQGRNIGKFAQLAEGSITEINENDLYGATAILPYAFYNRGSLERIVIPNGVKSVGSYSFGYCKKLKKVVLPESITSIDGRAFADNALLTRTTLKALTPPALKADTVSYIPATCMFEVPSRSLAAYKSAEGWKTISSQIVAIEE